MPQTMTTIPAWTPEDFYSDVVYEWLYNHQDNKFLFQRFLAQAQVLAKQLKVVGFSRMWNSYVDSMNPRKDAIFISDTQFPGQPITLQAGKYLCDDRGVSYIGMMGEAVQVCSHPLMPVRRLINVDSNEEKMEIAYARGGKAKWKTMVVGREVLASSQKIISLARNGIAVTSENAKEIVKYMSDLESMNYDSFEVQNAASHMGWLPDGQFAPYAPEIVYDGESPEFTRLCADFRPHGDESVWMDAVKAVRKGDSVPARIALAASFAAPLVHKLSALPFFVHIWGTQGCGKTVGLMLAASVWGNPEIGRYLKSFGGTKVSQELFASFCCNMPVLLDELQVVADRKSFDDIIYMLCEGVSKGRGAKEGGLQLQRRWSTCIVTTGEMPIVQGNSGGGAAVRTIEVNYGGQPLFVDARETANILKENYGFAGKRFTDAIRQDGVMDVLKSYQKKFYSELSGEIQDKQVLSASILLAADKLADKAIFHDGKALTVEDIKPYLITRDQADINVRCYNWLLGYIGGNPRRFEVDENNGELWGIKDKNVVYIIKPFFERILKAEGFSPGAFLTWAERNNKIITDGCDRNGKNKRTTKRKSINGSMLACVALITDETDEQKTKPATAAALPMQDSGYVELTDEQLPF